MTNIGIRLEESEKQAIVEYANAHDLSISQVVRRAIKEFLIKALPALSVTSGSSSKLISSKING